jgi:Recombination endonuclease VII
MPRTNNKEYQRAYRQKNLDRIRKHDRDRYAKNLDAKRASDRKWRYGITDEHYKRLMAEQNGLCAICTTSSAIAVDHNHTTKTVRALLCFKCNVGLGQFDESPERLEQAAAYLRKHA